ncbi:MAG: hypothetical protein ABI851_16520 [Saprospiraceae bacterium]
MKISVDLTRLPFNDSSTPIDFYDSKTIFFNPANILPSIVSFAVWGADISPNFDFGSNQPDEMVLLESIRKPNSLYPITIQGFGQLTFYDVVAGEISIFPFDDGNLIRRSDGTNLVFKREWNLNSITPECFIYELDTNIHFPPGGTILKLYCKGKVIFEFDSGDLVNSIEYMTNPNKEETFWGYRRKMI